MGQSIIEKVLDEATTKRLRETGQLQWFEAHQFVQVLEQQVQLAQESGKAHLKIETTLDDASRLAAFMRRAILLGA